MVDERIIVLRNFYPAYGFKAFRRLLERDRMIILKKNYYFFLILRVKSFFKVPISLFQSKDWWLAIIQPNVSIFK